MQKAKIAVYACLMLLTMVLIFQFSAQPSMDSAAVSSSVVQKIQDAGIENYVPRLWQDTLHSSVRKCAHVFSYWLLGITTALFCTQVWPARHAKACSIALLGCLLCAVSDELHQAFVPGRSASPIDIGFDALGFVPGVVIVFFCCALVRRFARQSKAKE